MGVYIDGLDIPKPIKGIKTCYDILIKSDGSVEEFDSDGNEYKAEEIDLVRCGECKHFHYDKPYVIQGMPILGHEVCDFWGDGCKTNPNGFCSYGERRADEK